MFVRAKKSGKYHYLQVVHNQRVEGKVRQQVIGTLGRVDVLEKRGQLDGLIASCCRYARQVAVLDAHRGGKMPAAESLRIGPSVVFERLWRESGMPKVIEELLVQRKYEFDVERAMFLALMLLKDLQTRMEGRGWRLHWDRLRHDLDALEEITLQHGGKTFLVRTRTLGDAGKAIQTVGVALGPTSACSLTKTAVDPRPTGWQEEV